MCVTEHRLVSARARRLRDKSISSIWSPASQELSVVGNAGVGIVSLKGAPLALPTFATPGFERFFGLGRAVRCLVPLGCRRFMHLVVLYGYFGADSCAEKFEAALGELAVVARGQPCLIVDDFNVEPTKIPCLAKGISAGLWVDLEASWAIAAGRDPAITCKRTWDSDSGNRRDFQIGCPLCAAAVLSCEVLDDRWIQPHLPVRTWFVADRWTAFVGLLLFGLPLGLLQLIGPGVLSLLRFEGFGIFMMSGLDGLMLVMPFLLIAPLLLVMSLVLVAPLVDLRRRLRAVLEIIAAIGRSGFTVSRGLELTRQWCSIVAGGPQGNISAGDLARISGLGLADMEASVVDLHQSLDSFWQSVVRSRRDRALLGWKA